jgi:hypothetical protein
MEEHNMVIITCKVHSSFEDKRHLEYNAVLIGRWLTTISEDCCLHIWFLSSPRSIADVVDEVIVLEVLNLK